MDSKLADIFKDSAGSIIAAVTAVLNVTYDEESGHEIEAIKIDVMVLSPAYEDYYDEVIHEEFSGIIDDTKDMLNLFETDVGPVANERAAYTVFGHIRANYMPGSYEYPDEGEWVPDNVILSARRMDIEKIEELIWRQSDGIT